MKKLTPQWMLGTFAIVTGAFAVAFLLGAVFGSLGMWEAAFMIAAAAIGATAGLMLVKAIRSASSRDGSAG
jgi:uncharacterized membrane protein